MGTPEPPSLARVTPYQQLFEAHPVPMWVYDIETLAFLAVNDAAVASYGYSRDEFLSMTIAEIRPLEDVPALLDNIAHLRGGLDRAGLWRHQCKDGTLIEVEITSHTIDWFGRRAEMVMALDVTGRRAIEAAVLAAEQIERERVATAIRESERRFRALIEHATDAIALFDEHGRVRYASPSAMRILSLPADTEELRLADVVHPEDLEHLAGKFAAALKTPGEPVQANTRAAYQDGVWRLLEGQFTNLLHEPSVRAVVANFRDVTSERQLEEQFHQSQRLDSIGRMAGGIAHDFNNLLTVILGYTELLEQDAADGRVDLSALEEIRRAGERARDLTQHLLVFARRQVLTPRQVNLNEVVRHAERLLARLLGEDVRIATHLAADLWPVEADAAQLEQVLVNLAVNARDAMPAGGLLSIATSNEADVTIRPGARKGTGEDAGYVKLVVGDTGEGIPSAVQDRIFEPFFTTKPPGRGTGLGLSTVYGIVMQSGGTIAVESDQGCGASFTIRLPRAVGPTAAQTTDPQLVASRRGSEQILVVEDDPGVRDLTVRTLQHAGYQVLVAGHGSEVRALLGSLTSPLALLVTDIVMPGMSGRQIAQSVVAQHPSVKVLYVSGYTQDIIDHHGVLATGVELLRKPFTPSVLLSRVRDILDKKTGS